MSEKKWSDYWKEYKSPRKKSRVYTSRPKVVKVSKPVEEKPAPEKKPQVKIQKAKGERAKEQSFPPPPTNCGGRLRRESIGKVC